MAALFLSTYFSRDSEYWILQVNGERRICRSPLRRSAWVKRGSGAVVWAF
jgi:hypothetical protein